MQKSARAELRQLLGPLLRGGRICLHPGKVLGDFILAAHIFRLASLKKQQHILSEHFSLCRCCRKLEEHMPRPQHAVTVGPHAGSRQHMVEDGSVVGLWGESEEPNQGPSKTLPILCNRSSQISLVDWKSHCEEYANVKEKTPELHGKGHFFPQLLQGHINVLPKEALVSAEH